MYKYAISHNTKCISHFITWKKCVNTIDGYDYEDLYYIAIKATYYFMKTYLVRYLVIHDDTNLYYFRRE